MPKSYYYADENSQPVGPLSLDEIRRFAEAGVVPFDVMVCEAEGENWRGLNTFGSQIGAITISESRDSAPQTSGPATTASHLKLIYLAALLSALIAFALDSFGTRAGLENAGIDPSSVRDIFSWITALTALAAQLTLIYHLVRSFPKLLQFTTPVKAAGFYVIPLFSFYWVFYLFHGMVSSTRKWGNEISPALSARISWLHPFAFVAAGFIILGEVVVFFEIFGSFEDANPRATRTNFVMAYFAYAAANAAFFHFTLSVVQILRGLLDPQDYEKESISSEKERGFLSFGSIKWGQSYGYILFFILAWMAWR